MYLFYEFLTLVTLPIVMHQFDNKARHAGRQVKLTYMLVEAPNFEVVEDGRDGSDGCNGENDTVKQPSQSLRPSRKGAIQNENRTNPL